MSRLFERFVTSGALQPSERRERRRYRMCIDEIVNRRVTRDVNRNDRGLPAGSISSGLKTTRNISLKNITRSRTR